MMRRASFILIAVAGALLAQPGISPPLAGFIRCEDVKLWPVYGLAGNFVRGTLTALSLPGGARLLGEENELVYRKADGAEVHMRCFLSSNTRLTVLPFVIEQGFCARGAQPPCQGLSSEERALEVCL